MSDKQCACGDYHELNHPHFTGGRMAEIAERNWDESKPYHGDIEWLLRRVVRLETIVARLCDEAARGQGSMGKPFWDFVAQIREEHVD